MPQARRAVRRREIQYLIDTHYTPVRRPFAACQPRDLLDQVIDMAHYRNPAAA